jgi:UPF0755 protein
LIIRGGQVNTEVNTTSRRSKIPKIINTIIIIIIIVAVFIAFWVNTQLQPADSDKNKVVRIKIESKSTTNEIAHLLKNNGLIKNEFVFKVYSRITGLDRQLKAGDYALNPSFSLTEIINKLVSGSVNLYTFTIPEGYTIQQIADSLEQKGFIKKEDFIKQIETGKFDFPYINDLSESENRLEGFLFPDTYKIPDYYNETQIIEMMLNRFLDVYDADLVKKTKEMKMSVLEAVTLASIIEREVRVPEERKKVSGVFHNRLKIGMPLQSCATVQYILGETKEALTTADTEKPSPYNTYLHKGLPPGPISNPGRASLEAAVYPENVEYYYFCSKGDGSHHFSTTLAEHNAAKRKYLK